MSNNTVPSTDGVKRKRSMTPPPASAPGLELSDRIPSLEMFNFIENASEIRAKAVFLEYELQRANERASGERKKAAEVFVSVFCPYNLI